MKSVFQYIKKHEYLILTLIIAFAVIRLIILFSFRDGHHVDETWSYGFANSYYAPHLYSTSRYGGLEEENWKNIDTWITGETFKEYITVSSDQRFSFDSVMYNKNDDLNPPLYELILHFVCSFFPGRFSWFYAFVISLIFYIPTLILVFVISRDMTGSDFCGFLSLVYYVFSGCGTANFLYLRVYHLFTFLTLFLFWCMFRIWNRAGNRNTIYFCLLPVITLMGCFTQFYYLVMAFFFTLFFALLLLANKRVKDMFALGFSMLFAVVLFFVSYPPSLRKIMPFTSGEGSVGAAYSYPYSWDLAVANKHFFNGTMGFYIPFNIPDIVFCTGIFAFIAIIYILVVFLFRNENWMKNFRSGLRNSFSACLKFVRESFKKIDKALWIAVLSSIICMAIIPYSADLFRMGFVERYFFPAMSLFLIAYVSIIGVLLESFRLKNTGRKFSGYIVSLILVSMVLFCIHSGAYTYIFSFDYMKDREATNALNGKDCYVLINNLRDIIWLSPILADCNRVYVEYSGSDSLTSAWDDLDSDIVLYLVVDGFMSEEQKEGYDADGEFAMEESGAPRVMMTEVEFIEQLEESTGYTYECINEYDSFIGFVHLYACKN